MNCFKSLLCEVCDGSKNFGNAKIMCSKCEKELEEIMEMDWLEEMNKQDEAILEMEELNGGYPFD